MADRLYYGGQQKENIKMKHYFLEKHILKGYKSIGRCLGILKTVSNSLKAAKRVLLYWNDTQE